MEYLESLFGFWSQWPGGWMALGIAAIILILGFTGAPLWLWTLFIAILFYGFGAPMWAWIVLGVFAIVFLIPFMRRNLFTGPVMKLMEALHFLPKISETEQTAIEAGTVWMDGELFSGKPDFKK